MKKFIPLEKMSKKAQREFYNRQRKSWNGVDHRTRVVPNKRNTIYNRKKLPKEFGSFELCMNLLYKRYYIERCVLNS